ncbi:hypothetical protein Pcinc_005666 [Petrolisthes cinctipes]|uniref:Uncharacterized protein n=1 Tax=Petrolisthes cinctipes TaxID=88211 RepID=A0AAE1GD10_PETCI|nr:hypothetical protein Pcinc_005666 [Petrolisthes cinctipes]
MEYVSGGAWEDGRAGEQEVVVVLRKEQLDKANKDTHHKLLPEDFQLELWWMVTYVNKGGGGGGGGGGGVGGPDSSSTPSTITPSGSSSDTDDDEDEDDDEDWDSDVFLFNYLLYL